MTNTFSGMLKKRFNHVKILIINAMVFYEKYNQISSRK